MCVCGGYLLCILFLLYIGNLGTYTHTPVCTCAHTQTHTLRHIPSLFNLAFYILLLCNILCMYFCGILQCSSGICLQVPFLLFDKHLKLRDYVFVTFIFSTSDTTACVQFVFNTNLIKMMINIWCLRTFNNYIFDALRERIFLLCPMQQVDNKLKSYMNPILFSEYLDGYRSSL